MLAGAVPLGGWLADSAGGRAVALCAAGLSAAVAALLWQLIGSGMGAAAWLGQLLLAVPAGICLGALADAPVAAVPAAVRVPYTRCACLFCWRACGLDAHSGTVCHRTHTLENTNPQAQGTPLAFTHALGGSCPLTYLPTYTPPLPHTYMRRRKAHRSRSRTRSPPRSPAAARRWRRSRSRRRAVTARRRVTS